MLTLIQNLERVWTHEVRERDFGKMRCETQTTLELISGQAQTARKLIQIADRNRMTDTQQLQRLLAGVTIIEVDNLLPRGPRAEKRPNIRAANPHALNAR